MAEIPDEVGAAIRVLIREACGCLSNDDYVNTLEAAILAALAAAKEEGLREEREACAKACDEEASAWAKAIPHLGTSDGPQVEGARDCAKAIRARSVKP